MSPSEIIITCDSIRLSKVFALAASLFTAQTEEDILESLLSQGIEKNIKLIEDANLKLNLLSVHGLNIHRSIEEVASQISSTLLEANFLKYPKLHQLAINWRKKVLELN